MISLNPLFQDGAVFQQKKTIPVWGTSTPGNNMKAEFAGKTAFTRTSRSGKFELRLPAVGAGGPYTLTVTDLNAGESVVVNDILVGEVWVASGQSNMEYAIGSDWSLSIPEDDEPETPRLNRIQEKEYCDTIRNPERMRFLLVERAATGLKEDSFTGTWKYMTAENAPVASAVAAWFGRFIQEKLDVPVGLIISSWGGSIIEGWTSRAGLLSNPETAPLVLDMDEELREADLWNEAGASRPASQGVEDHGNKGVEPGWAAADVEDHGNKGVELGWAAADFDDSAWLSMKIPGSWIAQKISGNGAVWVRKEISLGGNWIGKDLVLETGGIDKQDITYFNGVEIGRTGKGFETNVWNMPRKYVIPAKLVRPGRNVIAIRAYSFMFDGAFVGRKSDYVLKCQDTEKLPLAGNWKVCTELDLGRLSPAAQKIGPENTRTPSILFNGMIRPLLPYAIRGVIWYQGESNAESVKDAASYLKKIETMIRDWRYAWEQGDFPFIQVELADFCPEVEPRYNPQSSWAVLRETQRKVCEMLPQVYLATAVGVGDLHDIHPHDKKSVGYRLAVNALHNVYNRSETVPCGPVLRNCSTEGDAIRLTFRFADGLAVKGDVSGSFQLAGPDKIFHPAENFSIEGGSLLLKSSKVKVPAAVRYGWAQAPETVLFNGAGLPASPFRTDEWILED